MNQQIGNRIKRARAMANMTQQALADATGNLVTKQAISKYEKGKVKEVNSTLLLALAKAMGIKIDYFFKRESIQLDGIEFRKNSTLGEKTRQAIEYKTINFASKYIEIENILNLGNGHIIPPIEKRPIIRSNEDAEVAAQKLREEWSLGQAPVSNLMEILELKGIKLYEIPLDPDVKFDGLSPVIMPGEIPVIAVKDSLDIVRKRFTVAHEHCHLNYNVRGEKPETLCHAFANEFLLPREQLIKELGRKRKKLSLWELKRLKGIYGISIQAILFKAKQLNIISDAEYKSIFIQFSKRGWRKKEPGDYIEKEKANRFKQLVLRAASEDIISMARAAEFLNMTLSEIRERVIIF